jgi:hypothetical protein
MATPVYVRPTDKRYLGNNNPSKMEVHDLQNEQTNCQIDEILRANHAVVFDPDTLEQARSEGYDNCAYCIGGSTR